MGSFFTSVSCSMDKLKSEIIPVSESIPDEFIISVDQVGYIKNRYIGENIRMLSDILQLTDLENIEAYITQIDFEKAFDSVEWEFLFNVLKILNFGNNYHMDQNIIYKHNRLCR